jgi:hypothetical protein
VVIDTCSTKELSISMTTILHAVKGGLLSYCDKVYSRGSINQNHHIGGVMVRLLTGQTKDYIARLALNNNHSFHYLFTKPYFL